MATETTLVTSEATPPPAKASAASKWGLSPERGLWLFGLLGLLIGGYGLYLHLTTGLQLTALSSYVPWGLGAGTYVYFVWLEVGTVLVFTLLVYVFKWNSVLASMARLVYLTALAILAMALVLIGLDLGHPFRFWHVLVYPQWGSLMTWMVWLHIAFMALLLAMLAIEVRGQSPTAKRWGTRLAYFGLPLGLAVVVVEGSLYGVVAARPAWQGSAMPLYFVLSTLLAGTGLLTFQFILFWPDKREAAYLVIARRLGKLLLGLLTVGLVAAALGGMVVLYPGVPAEVTALEIALFGSFWWVFWIVHVGLGMLVPIALLLTGTQTARRIGVAAGLLIVTFIAVPLNIVIPPQLVVGVVEKGLVAAYTGPGLTADYFPTMAEWLVTLFAMATGFLIFLFGYHFVSMRPQHANHSIKEDN